MYLEKRKNDGKILHSFKTTVMDGPVLTYSPVIVSHNRISSLDCNQEHKVLWKEGGKGEETWRITVLNSQHQIEISLHLVCPMRETHEER